MNFIIQIIVGLVLSLASTLIKSMFQQDQQQVPGVRGELQKGGDRPLSFIMGHYATGGHLKYAGTWGESGGAPNAFFSQVISVSDLPIRGYTGFFINGERVTLAEEKTTTIGYAVLEYRDDNGVDHLWVNPYLGNQTSADPLMRAKFGSDEDRPYTSDMIGRGVAYFVVTARVNRELFPGFPEVIAEVNGIALDDPRGDGKHDNPIVGIYTLMKGIYYDGEWVYGPQNITDANFVYANLEAQMDKCDVVLEDTEQPRFRFGYEVSVDTEPHAVIGELLKACEGRVAEIGGIYKFLVGEPDAPVVSITDEDVVITDEQTYEPFPGFESIFNGIGATYPEPEEAWQIKEAPPRYRSDLEELDDNRRLPFNTEYKAVPYPLQVQALMRAAVEEVRRFRTEVKTMPPEWWEFEPLDSYLSTSARNGWVNKQFLITAMDDLPNGKQVVGSREIDPSDYSWSSDYELPWDVTPLIIARPPPQEASGFYVLAVAAKDSSGRDRRPAIDAFWDDESVTDDVRAVRITVAIPDEVDPDEPGPIIWEGNAPRPKTGSARLTEGLVNDCDYLVQIEYQTYSGRATLASSWLPVTTLDIRLSDIDMDPIQADVLDGSITSAKIADAAITAAKLMNEAVTELKLANEAVSTAKIKVAAVTADILANNAVIASKIASGAVTTAKFAAGIEPVGISTAGTLPTTKSTTTIVWQNEIYRWNGTAYVKSVAAADIAGEIASAQIAALAASKITGQLTSGQISDLNATKLTGQITSVQISNDAISAPKISAGAITTGKIAAGAVTADEVAANAITAGKVAAGAIEAASIAAGAVQAGKIAAGAVTADTVAANAITADKVAANAITAGKIAAGAVSATEIAAGAITASKLFIGDTTNMFPDPMFVDTPNGYSVTTGLDGSVNFAQSQINTNCFSTYTIRINGAVATTGGVIGPAIPTEVGKSYYISGFCGAVNNAGQTDNCETRLYMRWYDQTNALLSSSLVGSSTANYSTLTEPNVVGKVTAPTGATYGRVYMYRVGSATTDGAVFGGITVRRAGGGDLIVDGGVVAESIATNAITSAKIDAGAVTTTALAAGAVTADKIQAGAVVADKIAAGSITGEKLVANSITARELILTDFENLVPNGSFVLGNFAGWSGEDSTVYITSVADAPTRYVMAFAPRTTVKDMNAIGTNVLPCKPGEEFWARFDAETAMAAPRLSRIQMRIGFLDNAGNSLGPSIIAADSGDISSASWSTFTGSFTVPAGAAAINTVLIRKVAQAESTGSVNVTNVGIFRKANADLIVDGAITADKIAANAITAGKVAAKSLTADEIQGDSIAVDAGFLGSLVVGSAQIDNLAVTSSKIANLSVDTIKIANGAVTSTVTDTIADGTLPSGTNKVLTIAYSNYTEGPIQLASQFRLSEYGPLDDAAPVKLVLRRGGVIIRSVNIYPINIGGGEFKFEEGWHGINHIDIPPSSGPVSYTFTLSSSYIIGVPYQSYSAIGAYTKK